MATYTTNYNLIKPADADGYDIAHQNGNMDIIDGALNGINSNIGNVYTEHGITATTLTDLKNNLLTALANVETGQTYKISFTPGFTDENFVSGIAYVGYGHTMYKISQGTRILSAVVTGYNGDTVSIGYHADIGWKIEKLALNSKLQTQVASGVSFAENANGSKIYVSKTGNTVIINGYLTFEEVIAGNSTIFTLPAGFRPQDQNNCLAFSDNYNGNKTSDIIRVNTNGAVAAQFGSNNFAKNSHLFMSISFCT